MRNFTVMYPDTGGWKASSNKSEGGTKIQFRISGPIGGEVKLLGRLRDGDPGLEERVPVDLGTRVRHWKIWSDPEIKGRDTTNLPFLARESLNGEDLRETGGTVELKIGDKPNLRLLELNLPDTAMSAAGFAKLARDVLEAYNAEARAQGKPELALGGITAAATLADMLMQDPNIAEGRLTGEYSVLAPGTIDQQTGAVVELYNSGKRDKPDMDTIEQIRRGSTTGGIRIYVVLVEKGKRSTSSSAKRAAAA